MLVIGLGSCGRELCEEIVDRFGGAVHSLAERFVPVVIGGVPAESARHVRRERLAEGVEGTVETVVQALPVVFADQELGLMVEIDRAVLGLDRESPEDESG